MRCISLVAVLLFLSTPSPARAQGVIVPGVLEFAPSAGASIPTGSFSESVKTGYNLGGQLGIYAMPQLALGIGIVYNRFALEDILEGVVEGGNFDIWEFSLFGKYLFLTRGQTHPYAKLMTGGFYSDANVALTEPGYSVKGNETNFGLGGGVGVQYRIPKKVGFFAEALYMADFTEDTNTYYLSIRGGLNIYFRLRQW